MKKVYKYIFTLVILCLVFLSFSLYLSNIKINKKFVNSSLDLNYLILSYQYNRIQNETQLSSIFIGDSSLGNTIDEDLMTELFKSKTKNYALNEIYGLSGQYNLLKEILKNNKKINTVYLFTSIYFINSNNDSEAFFLTSDSIFDLLKAYNKIDFITFQFKYLIKFLIANFEFKTEEYNKFKNDNIKANYIKQNNSQNLLIPHQKKLNLKEKKYYLNMIKKLCDEKKIKLKIIKGPVFDQTYENSKIFVKNFEKLFENDDLNKTQIFLNDKQVGDQIMHPSPNYKKDLTKKYYNLIINE